MYTAYWNRIKSAIGEPAGTTFCSGFLEQEHRSRNVTDKALKKTIPNLLRILKQLDLLFVEKIFAANLIERGQAVGPACNDFFGSNTGLHLMDGIRISNKFDHFRDFKLFWVEFLQNRGDFQSYAHRTHFEAIRNLNGNAATALSAVKSGNRDERLSCKMQAREIARIQSGRHFIAIHPWRSTFLERSLRAASDGDSGTLENLDSRIKDGPLDRPKIWRGRNPFDAGALKEIIAMPVPHGNDVQVRPNVIFGVEELREFADRQRVAHRQRKVGDEIRLVRIEHRAFDSFPAKGVRPVEHEKSDISLRGFLHAIRHGHRVGVKPNARVLDIEDQRVDALEHFVGRPERFSIQAIHRETRRGILRGRHSFISAAGQSVLRAEQSNNLH